MVAGWHNQQDAFVLCGMYQVPGFTGKQGHRLFDQCMHASFHGCFSLFVVITVGRGDHNRIQLLLEQHR